MELSLLKVITVNLTCSNLFSFAFHRVLNKQFPKLLGRRWSKRSSPPINTCEELRTLECSQAVRKGRKNNTVLDSLPSLIQLRGTEQPNSHLHQVSLTSVVSLQ